MHGTDPPATPRDPASFKSDVYRRAARLRRNRVLGGAATASVIIALLAVLAGPLSPIIRTTGERLQSLTGGPSPTTRPTVPIPTAQTPVPTTTAGTRPTTTSGTQPGPTPTTTSPVTPTTTTVPTPPTTTIGNQTTTTAPNHPTTTTTIGPPTSLPPPAIVVAAACGEPAQSPLTLGGEGVRKALIGTWLQCSGPSLFPPAPASQNSSSSAGAGGGVPVTASGKGGIELRPNGTWVRLAQIPSGILQPLVGPDDSGTWSLLPQPAAAPAAEYTVRFTTVQATASPSAAAPPATTPRVAAPSAAKSWTAGVVLAPGPPERIEFIEGTIVANYKRFTTASSFKPPSAL